MRFSLPFRLFDHAAALIPVQSPAAGPAEPQPWLEEGTPGDESVESTLLRTLALVSAGVGALALGLLVGREIRLRYKFNRRTPYDFYAHAGDEHELEFGVGI